MDKVVTGEGSTDFLLRMVDLARERPNQVAAKDLERSLTYADLIDEAADVGSSLVSRGVRAGDRVALWLDNSVDFVVSALGALWIGAVFVPLNVNDPDERVEMILADCDAAVVIANDVSGGHGLVGRAVAFSVLHGATAHAPMIAAGSRPVYMIYTSGTTGTPKGVLIGNVAFSAAVAAAASALGLDETTRTLCVSPFYFDGSFGTLFPTLFHGGTVVIRPRASLLFPQAFFNAVAAEDITYTGFSPTYLRLLLASSRIRELAASTLEAVALGGEASSIVDVRALWGHAPELKVFNRYGPTETTIAVTHVLLTPDLVSNDVIPLGVPHPRVDFYLVDAEGVVVTEPLATGELYIGGIQLMDGYWAAPELTSTVLRNDVVHGITLYRTGDLVYRDSAGYYVYVERTDRVVKRGGVRISLGEIADVVRSVNGVDGVACVTYDREGDLGIIVFAAVKGGVSARDIRAAAGERLPANMLPDRIELVEEFPITSSGKLNERQLLANLGLTAARR